MKCTSHGRLCTKFSASKSDFLCDCVRLGHRLTAELYVCPVGTLLYPKSQIFRRGASLPSSSVFSSFRSLWQTPCTPSNGHYGAYYFDEGGKLSVTHFYEDLEKSFQLYATQKFIPAVIKWHKIYQRVVSNISWCCRQPPLPGHSLNYAHSKA